MVLILIILAVVSIGLLFWQTSNLISVIFGSPYVMVDKPTIRQALKLAELKKREMLYDLGCGNGDVLIEAAKKGAKATGFEISPYCYLWAKIKTAKYRNIKIHYQNIFPADISQADVIYCYLMPKILEKLGPKFQRELKVGTRVVSIGFPIKKMEKKLEQKINSRKIFIYVSP